MTALKRRDVLLALGCASGMAWAQPMTTSRPLRLVVPYGTGGAPDILARLFAQELSAAFGSAVVENKAGAGGTLGADVVAKAAADSRTLLVTTAATHVINPWLYPSFPYDPQRDFTPVGLLASTPLMLVTAANGPLTSLSELLATARAQPETLSYASAGTGTMQHIAGALMETMARVRLLHVPYKGSGQVMPDLIAGRVSMMFNSLAAVLPLVRSGQLRALAVTTRERLPAWPDLPTVAESGIAGFEANAWYAVFGPKGMSSADVQKVRGELDRFHDLPAVKERFATLGLEPMRGGPTELADLVQRDGQKWGAFLKERGIQLQPTKD